MSRWLEFLLLMSGWPIWILLFIPTMIVKLGDFVVWILNPRRTWPS